MARIFKDCLEMVQEMDRELKVSGITVPVKHYQNKELVGENHNTKELIGVNFIISKPSIIKSALIVIFLLSISFVLNFLKFINYCKCYYENV